jgi:hypothetical protein
MCGVSQMDTCQNLIHILLDHQNIINLLIMMNIWMHMLYEYIIYICQIQVVACNYMSFVTCLRDF